MANTSRYLKTTDLTPSFPLAPWELPLGCTNPLIAPAET
ncbi:hypothetical protein IAD21_04544 [Abditibacteriota bacterium]|nr:hypothetical protein IAD21_04544 [Abditibacteriota bacterium]